MNKSSIFFDLPEGDMAPAIFEEIQDETELKKSKKLGLFDHLKAITQREYDSNYLLDTEDAKTFDIYMINRFLSMNPDWVFLINWLQQYTHDMSNELVYKLYANIIPKSNTFLKYVKGINTGYKKSLTELFAKHYECSRKQATELITILLRYDKGKKPRKKDDKLIIPPGHKMVIEIGRLYAISEKEMLKLLK